VQNNDVHIVINQYTDTAQIIKYYKNGVLTQITDGTQYATAFDMFVSGNDVYICGNENNVAKYWKNGVAVTLSDGSVVTNAGSIVVKDSDVYVSGHTYISGHYAAKLWTNGVVSTLTSGEYLSNVNKIQLVGNDTYVGGFEMNEIWNNKAIYWKNETKMTITSETDDCGLWDLFITKE